MVGPSNDKLRRVLFLFIELIRVGNCLLSDGVVNVKVGQVVHFGIADKFEEIWLTLGNDWEQKSLVVLRPLSNFGHQGDAPIVH